MAVVNEHKYQREFDLIMAGRSRYSSTDLLLARAVAESSECLATTYSAALILSVSVNEGEIESLRNAVLAGSSAPAFRFDCGSDCFLVFAVPIDVEQMLIVTIFDPVEYMLFGWIEHREVVKLSDAPLERWRDVPTQQLDLEMIDIT